MKVEIKVEPQYEQPLAVIYTADMTDEVQAAVKALSESQSDIVTGFHDGNAEILEPDDIYRIYSENQRVLAVTDKGIFQIRARLYQLEERLKGYKFVRISQSELINLKQTKRFDLSFAGTIQVEMKNGQSTYVSRRYVVKIKDVLGI